MAPQLPKGADRFRQVWDGDSEMDCVDICRDLQKAGIEYRTDQQPVSRTMRMGVEWKFRVYVLTADYENARRALGYGEETENDESVFEIKETGTGGDLNQEYEAKSHGFLNKWDVKRATIEIGAQSPMDESSIVELSLTENLIHYRVEHLANGARKYFVQPEDEGKAREIIREIKEGDPPT